MTTQRSTEKLTEGSHYNPYLNGIYAPVDDEITASELRVEGEIPRDLFGAYVRNGPNPGKSEMAMHHWFDGDAMLHGIFFEDGKATYRNRYVRTDDFVDGVEGNCAATGILEPAKRLNGQTVYKDTSNTDVVFHNGQLMSLWYISGQPVRLNPVTLETIGNETFDGKLPRNISAHSKVDGKNGDFVFFDYHLYQPWMSYGVVNAQNELVNFQTVELPGPRLPHDMGLTENYAVLMDLPVVFTDKALQNHTWNIHIPKDLPARFGVVPRRGKAEEIKWFSCDPCYIYHVSNAWEEGDEVVMHACKMIPNHQLPDPSFGAYSTMALVLTLQARPFEWRFNMKTGQHTERQLSDEVMEFPAVNQDHIGYKSRYSYAASIPNTKTLVFDGLIKTDLMSGRTERHDFGFGIFGSEPAYAPRIGGQGEDDGYVLTFVTNAVTNQSEVLILDAKNFTDKPVARVFLPQRVPAGFHACWANGDRINANLLRQMES